MGTKNEGNSCLSWIFLILVFFTLVAFSPGIVVASIFNSYMDIGIGPLWGITLVVCIILAAMFYFSGENGLKNYAIMATTVTVICFILFLFKSDNFIGKCTMRMYMDVFLQK